MDHNNCIHPNFKLHGTVTGRLSGEDGVHQVPRDKFIRGLIGAPPGWSFFEIDGSQIELRVVAAIANEHNMLAIYAMRGDIHRTTAGGPVWQQAKLESWLGDLAWSRSLPDVAIVHFRRALELESRNETARLKLAELLLQYGPEEAQGHLEQLRGLKPENRDMLLRLSACYRELGEGLRAAELLREARLEPLHQHTPAGQSRMVA